MSHWIQCMIYKNALCFREGIKFISNVSQKYLLWVGADRCKCSSCFYLIKQDSDIIFFNLLISKNMSSTSLQHRVIWFILKEIKVETCGINAFFGLTYKLSCNSWFCTDHRETQEVKKRGSFWYHRPTRMDFSKLSWSVLLINKFWDIAQVKGHHSETYKS